MPRIMRMPVHQCNGKARMLSVARLYGFAAYLLVLPGRRVAHLV